jgi:hypothetical protein
VDSKVENIVDLGLVNFVRHPSDSNYIVYRFADKKRADDFEKELKQQKIWFEKGEEEARNKTYTLYGVHKKHFEKAQRINFAVEANNRNFLISNKVFRYTLLTISLGTLILAFVGYCSRPTNLEVLQNTELNE